jgi:phosphonate metabolism protein PhnN/1,5-bisphosphokinase (PRPP-forming)
MLAPLKAEEATMLVLVVGPSGAGKDSLLNAARDAFRDDHRVHFVRRVITRPADPDGENHEPVTEAEFGARTFALSWSAHGLHYGIPAEATAPIVVANVSRGVIATAAAEYPVRVIEVTAPPDILSVRLAARGRESSADVARRLGRTATIPAGVATETVWNDATLAIGAARFIAALRRIVDAAPQNEQ